MTIDPPLEYFAHRRSRRRGSHQALTRTSEFTGRIGNGAAAYYTGVSIASLSKIKSSPNVVVVSLGNATVFDGPAALDVDAKPGHKGIWMPSIYQLKPAFQARLRPLVAALARAGITPNQVTAFALLLSVIGGLLIYLMPQARWPLLVLPVVLFIRMALNAVDGMLAREHDMQTDLGAMFNELSDVVADAALYLPLAYVAVFSPLGVITVVFLGVVAEMTGVVAQTVGASRRYDGPLGKSDRAFVFGALSVWVALFGGPVWLIGICLGVASILGLVTIANRVRGGLAEAENSA